MTKRSNKEILSQISENESEHCCSSTPIYEITYNYISRKWLVCNECLEIECFKADIKEKVRIQQ